MDVLITSSHLSCQGGKTPPWFSGCDPTVWLDGNGAIHGPLSQRLHDSDLNVLSESASTKVGYGPHLGTRWCHTHLGTYGNPAGPRVGC